MLKPLILLACLVLLPVLCFAATTAEEGAARDTAGTMFVAGYLSRLKNGNSAIFYAECRLKHGGKAGIIIPLGKDAGMYIERRSDNTVANTADMTWGDGKWNIQVTQGGVYTITRATNLIEEILGYSFRLILPDKIDLIPTSEPKSICVEKLPE